MRHTDGAPEDVLAIAHPHWTQFPPTHPIVQVTTRVLFSHKNLFLNVPLFCLQHFFGLVFFVLWVISTVGNGLVIYIFLK